MYEVGADRRGPSRRRPGLVSQAAWSAVAEGIVIVEQVVLARVVHQSARIVDPPLLYSIVVLRTISFAVNFPGINLNGELIKRLNNGLPGGYTFLKEKR